ncbi:response regulator [Mucilaginibacter sp. 22184]|uniref:response regulator n=1 Tax=Mucilaginibacter sp. 22184 TaxID=3453887 RepID=UPI003F82E612
MAFLIIIELFTLSFAIKTLSAVRSYVGGEGLWSKAQKDALSHLKVYAYSHNEQDYQAFQQFLKVPLGDGAARTALERMPPDYDAARLGFLEGRNHPNDIDGMIKLMLRFNQVKYLKQTIFYWKKAEGVLIKLIPVSKQLHDKVLSGTTTALETQQFLEYISAIDAEFTPMEDGFSYSLGEGSRWFENLVLKILIGLAFTVELTGILIAISISNGMQKGIKEIISGAKKVSEEEFDTRVKVYSKDEIGILATAFNQMTDKLEHTIYELKNAKVKERRQLERAEASEKIKQVFIANMNHEFLTPMNAIMGFAGLLQESEMNTEQKEYIRAIMKSGEFLKGLLNNILDLSKIGSGNVQLEKQPVSIRDVVHNAVAMLKPEVNKKSLAISYHIDADIPDLILGDEMRLSHILLNLLSNSVKFTHQGAVMVEAYVIDDTDDVIWVGFSIQDTGIGIPAEKQDKIFESLDQFRQNKGLGGIGLGLSMAKHLVDLHGGDLFIKTSTPRGSDFRFLLPFDKYTVIAEQPVIDNASNGCAPENETKNTRILVADDNHLNQLLIIKVLEKRGYCVDAVDNGKQALEKLQQNHYDIILMDLDMPQLNGYEATAAIRGEDNGKNTIPIIAITAHATREVMEKCIDHGMNDFVAKPFDAHDLDQKIKAILIDV